MKPKALSDDEADALVAKIYNILGKMNYDGIVLIDRTGSMALFNMGLDPELKYEIGTDAGASFEFGIYGKTKDDVANAYLDHLISVYEYVMKEGRSLTLSTRLKYIQLRILKD